MPKIQTFRLDENIVADCIYKDFPHQTTPTGLVVERRVKDDLRQFLQRFLDYSGCPQDSFLRVDAFVRENSLEVIEVNVECQEGWGISLNLLRASSNIITFDKGVCLPCEIIAYSENYLPEFLLTQKEFVSLGHRMDIVGWQERPGVPARGEFDNKVYLAEFSRVWNSLHPGWSGEYNRGAQVPTMYSVSDTAWDKVPQDVVFKFCNKYGTFSNRAKYSVAARSQIGKGKFVRRCYELREVIAQQRVCPLELERGLVTQAIIMCAGQEPVTGYLQVAPPGTFVINDKSASKGPLVFL